MAAAMAVAASRTIAAGRKRREAFTETSLPVELIFSDALPRILRLLLLRPEVVGNPIDVFIAKHVLPRRHIERRSGSGGIVQRRHTAIANDGDDLVLGVVIGDVQQRGHLAALGVSDDYT